MDRRFLAITGLVAIAVFCAVLLWPAPSDGASESWLPVYYSECAVVRAAGKAPLYKDQPGYRSELDADSDGIACEPYPGMDGIIAAGPGRWVNSHRLVSRKAKR